MRFREDTDVEGYHWRTLLWCVRYGCWSCGVDWKDWRLRWTYIWYDGPNWALEVGPFWVSLSA